MVFEITELLSVEESNYEQCQEHVSIFGEKKKHDLAAVQQVSLKKRNTMNTETVIALRWPVRNTGTIHHYFVVMCISLVCFFSFQVHV